MNIYTYDQSHCTQQKYHVNNGSCASENGIHLIDIKRLCLI